MGSRGLVWKLLILLAVTLLICIVLARIGWLVDERQQRQREAVAGVGESQAGAQVLLGPLAQRHCVEEWDTVSGDGVTRKVGTDRRDFTLTATPSNLVVSGDLNAELRYRGLFKVNGYAGALQLDAEWPSLDALQPRPGHANGRLQCGEPQAMLAVSDARGLRMAVVTLDGRTLVVKPGTAHAGYGHGLHVDLPGQALDQPLKMKISLQLAGTQSFALVPAAAATQLSLQSDWPHPSFGGRFLPGTREVTDHGFSAQWQLSELATTAAADVIAGKAVAGLGGTGNGVVDTLEFSMVDPVNPYVMSDRAIKYGLIFVVLTFVCVGLVELLSGRRVHPVQYLFVGLALSVFFLLLLSLSEHLSFERSYLLAAGCAVLLLGHYGAAMLGGWLRGLAFGVGISGLYGALYVLLVLEQASLVIGALMLFAVLAVVMSLTRRLDWYALGARPLTADPDAQAQ